MRKWALSICCAVLLISGCSSNQTATEPENSDDTSQKENPAIQQLLTSKGTALAESAEELEETTALESTELLSPVVIQQIDGTAVEWMGNAVVNEALGYSIYLLPGFRADIDSDSATLTISTPDGQAQAVLEALPPRADVQAAADELKNSLQLLDEQVKEIKDYERLSFWWDTKIYRAYNGEKRITAMIKNVQEIPFRITVTEPTNTDALLLFMAMIETIQMDNLEALTEPREELVHQLVIQAYLQQQAVLMAFQGDHIADKSMAAATENLSADTATDYTMYWTEGSKLSDILLTKESVIAYLETVYTPSAAAELVDTLALREENNRLVSDWKTPQNKLQWEHASYTAISEAENSMRYLVRIPSGEDIYELREIVVQKFTVGWRIQTPLNIAASLAEQDVKEVPPDAKTSSAEDSA